MPEDYLNQKITPTVLYSIWYNVPPWLWFTTKVQKHVLIQTQETKFCCNGKTMFLKCHTATAAVMMKIVHQQEWLNKKKHLHEPWYCIEIVFKDEFPVSFFKWLHAILAPSGVSVCCCVLPLWFIFSQKWVSAVVCPSTLQLLSCYIFFPRWSWLVHT